MIEKLRLSIGRALMGLAGSISPFASEGEDVHKDIYGRLIKDADVFFYPQKIKGVPVFDIDSVMKHYQKEILELRRFVPIGDHQVDSDGRKLFDTMYLDVIYRFAEYIHLIPASEDHHHRGPGGLLIHSMQTAHKALIYAENKKYKRSGFLDLDKEMSVRARYATWVAGLMHDTGKILRDLHVDAVEQINKSGVTIPAVGVATWMPHLQTLIDWAKDNNVATYSVSYVRHRTHNAHNLDSSHLLPYILGRGHAMRYLVEAPCENLYSEVAKILSGMDSESYISRAVKEGDAHSTMKDMSVYHDIMTGVKNKSVGSRVVMLMKMAKANWEWNTPGGEGWIIGGHCYIRWPNAIQSIIKESIKHGQAIPHDNMALVVLMEDNGLIKRYDAKHLALKFTKGQFSEEEVTDIAAGRKAVPWEELIRIQWDGHLFGDDPRPNNCKGVLYLPESSEYIAIDRAGNTRFVVKDSAPASEPSAAPVSASVPEDKPVQPKPVPASKAQKEAGKSKKEKSPAPSASLQTESPAASSETDERSKTPEPAQVTIQAIDIDTSALDSAPENAEQSKGIVFARKKTKSSPTKPEADLTPAPEIEKPKQAEPIQLPEAINALVSKGATFWGHDGSVFIEVDKAKGIGAADLKAIKTQYLEIDQGAAAALAKNITIGGRTFLAAKMKTPIAKTLTSAGLVSAPSAVEASQDEVKDEQTPNQAGAHSKTLKADEVAVESAQQAEPAPDIKPAQKKSMRDSQQTKSDMEAANLNAVLTTSESKPQIELEPAPLEYMTEPSVFKEGTLGWILETAGVDISQPQIEFSKSKFQKVVRGAGRKVYLTKIESIIRSAGFKVESLEGDGVAVEQAALSVKYWEV